MKIKKTLAMTVLILTIACSTALADTKTNTTTVGGDNVYYYITANKSSCTAAVYWYNGTYSSSPIEKNNGMNLNAQLVSKNNGDWTWHSPCTNQHREAAVQKSASADGWSGHFRIDDDSSGYTEWSRNVWCNS